MHGFELTGIWRLGWQPVMPEEDFDSRPVENLIDITVPGDIHQALMREGIISDPQLADNAANIDWISDQEWWFFRDFAVDESDLERPAELVFQGLDYQADVWINGTYAGRHLNAFRPLKISLTGKIENHNNIAVRLLPFRDDLDQLPDHNMVTEDDKPYRISKNGICWKRPWMRKPQYVFGWNWTWHLATCGITAGVLLNIHDFTVIENPAVFTESINNNSAILKFIGNIKLFDNNNLSGNINIKIFRKGGEDLVAEFSQPVKTTGLLMDFELYGELNDPELWWPAGMGEQNLYDAEFNLENEADICHHATVTFGVRTVKVDESPRKQKGSWKFRFIINNEPVFIKGANWVPPDTCYTRITSGKRRKLLEMARECNLNYLRVWGGGIYEPDEFYDWCDELGILVWQDFMFSCAEYPDFDADFRDEAKREIDYQTKRLRNHPSIIIWCGNNEIEQQKFMMRELRPQGKYFGETLFKELIPGWLKKLDPSRPYTNSSGCSGTNDSNESCLSYNSGVVHHDIFYELIKRGPKKIPSFLGEWYTASPPVLKTIKEFIPGTQCEWSDKTWRMHDFVSHEFIERVDRYIAPLRDIDFEKTLYYFHCLQMEMIKSGMELCRKHLWECSGNVTWMYADAFNGFTRTIIDYCLRRKPAFHVMKRACVPIIAIAEDLGDYIEVSIVNETPDNIKGILTITNYTFAGKMLLTSNIEIKVNRNSTAVCRKFPRNILGCDNDSFLWMEITGEKGNVINENRFFLDSLINLKLPLACPEIKTSTCNGKTIISITSDKYVRNFRVQTDEPEDLSISDNWFDICPGKIKTVKIISHIDSGILRYDWENRRLNNEKLITYIGDNKDVDASGIMLLPIEIYNPDTVNKLDLELKAELPEPWGKSVNLKLSVKPENTVKTELPLYVSPGNISMDAEIVCKYKKHIIRRKKQLNIAPPWTVKMKKDFGKFTVVVESNCVRSILDGELQILCEGQGGYEEKTLKMEISPFSRKLISLDNVEYKCITVQLCSKDRVLARDIFVDRSITNCILLSPQTDNYHAVRTGNFCPALLNSHGFKIQRDGMQAVFFTSFSGKAFYFDVILFGKTLERPTVELALSIGKGLGFEAEYVYDGKNNIENIRRINGVKINRESIKSIYNIQKPSFAPPNINAARIDDDAVLFRCIIPWNYIKQDCMPNTDNIIKFAAVLNFNNMRHLKIFKGIHGVKDASGYGRIYLQNKGVFALV